MNDGMNLREWFSLHDSYDDKRNLFNQLDAKMKYIHEHGYYISDFNLDKIMINNNNVDFLKLGSMTNDDYQKLINSNIYTMAFLEIGSYSNCIDFLKPSFLNENFEEFVPFMPKEDVAYYRSVIKGQQYNYFSDYCKYIEARKDVQNNTGNSNTNQRTYSKSTAAGKLYSDDKGNLNNAAYVNIFLLTGFVITTTLVTLLGIILMNIR